MTPTSSRYVSPRTYAQPLAGLQVSWGAVLAGAVALLATTLLLWLLASAIILTATKPNVDSLMGSLKAMAICSIVTTLIGGLVGGALAGYLPGNGRRLLGGVHGFLAWAVAFVVAFSVETAAVSSLTRTATDAVVTTAGAAVQGAGSAVGNVAGGGGQPLQMKAYNLLVSLGYPPPQARQMVADAQRELQSVLSGSRNAQGQAMVSNAGEQVRGALDTLLNWSAAAVWAFFGTWLVTAGLAVLGGMATTRRVRDRLPGEPAEESEGGGHVTYAPEHS